jgi:hypothetical protein
MVDVIGESSISQTIHQGVVKWQCHFVIIKTNRVRTLRSLDTLCRLVVLSAEQSDYPTIMGIRWISCGLRLDGGKLFSSSNVVVDVSAIYELQVCIWSLPSGLIPLSIITRHI